MSNSIECQAEQMIAADIASGSVTKYQALLILTLIGVHFHKAMQTIALESLVQS